METGATTWRLVSLALLLQVVNGAPRVVRIGAILSRPEEESALDLAVDYVNQEQLMGPDLVLEQLTNRSGVISAFSAIQSVCDQAALGIMGLVGPISSTGTQAVAPMSRFMRIPQIAPTATNPLLGDKSKYPYLLRMVPPDSKQSMAIVALMEALHWTRFAILTSNTDYGVNGLLQFQSAAARRKWRILSVQHFEAPPDPEDTDATKQLEVIQSTGVRVVILNCLSDFGLPVLRQARRLGMLDAGWAWVVTDGVSGQGPPLPADVAGLLGTRPASGRGQLWDALRGRWGNADPVLHPATEGPLQQYPSSVMDAVLAFAYAVRDLHRDGSATNLTQSPLNCMKDTWKHGPLMLRYLKQVSGPGAGADISFNSAGSPSHPVYDIVNLHPDGEWHTLGEWDPTQGLQRTGDGDLGIFNLTLPGGQTQVTDYVSQLTNRTLRVVLHKERPFVRLTTDNYDPNDVRPDQVEGLCIDLLNRLAETIGFNYSLYIVPDLQFGEKDPATFQWDGLVGELVQRKADMAVASLTINNPREQDIDFTKPYLDLGMRFVMQVPPVVPPDPFGFLDPFQQDVWMMTLLMTLVVGIYVSLLNKLSPYDHHGRYVYRDYAEANKYLESNVLTCYKKYKQMTIIKRESMAVMNFSNSVWLAIATLLHQGGEAYPKSCSARLAMLTWLLAIVILVATYTANLAAFLTASRSKTTIDSIEDLGAQSKVKYGTVRSSAPRQFFEDSNVTLYKDMLLYMTQQNTFVNQTETGIAKARQGGYAFIWDSAVLDYNVEEKPCDTLRNVGRLFGKIGYGFGLQKSSPYKDELSYHILRLREEGYMEYLVNKWYREKGECSQGNKDRSEHDKAIEAAGGKLGIGQLLGVFLIVFGGICLSVIVLILEWIVIVQSAVDKQDPLRPNTFCESLSTRIKTLLQDFREEMALLFHWREKDRKSASNPTISLPNNSIGVNGVNGGPIRRGSSTSNHVVPVNDVRSEDDVILSIAGSIARRQRSELGSPYEMSIYSMTSSKDDLNLNYNRDSDSEFMYGNPAFRQEENHES